MFGHACFSEMLTYEYLNPVALFNWGDFPFYMIYMKRLNAIIHCTVKSAIPLKSELKLFYQPAAPPALLRQAQLSSKRL